MTNLYEVLSAKVLEPQELTLTCKGMGSVNLDCSDSDFEFVLGDDRVSRLPYDLAEFVYPKVARLRRCDISFDVYRFKESELFNAFESLVSSLLSGDALRVTKANFPALLCLSQELENDDLFSLLLGMHCVESLSLSEAMLLLRAGIDLGAGFSDGFENLRDTIASHFYELDREKLDFETIQILLLSPSLKIEDEDSLYDLVRSRSQNDVRFTSLFELVYFEYLSVDRIENFVSSVSGDLLEIINSRIWSQICRRLVSETKRNGLNTRVKRKINLSFVYRPKTLDGIIAYLTRECGGNVHDKGVVDVTARSYTENAKRVADLLTPSYYCSRYQPDSWICYDFKDFCVIPTSYAVRSYPYTRGGNHLRSWVIEVSKDGTDGSWTVIDRREGIRKLDREDAIANFVVRRVPSEGIRFFRLKQTGKNHAGEVDLRLSALEIFGTISNE